MTTTIRVYYKKRMCLYWIRFCATEVQKEVFSTSDNVERYNKEKDAERQRITERANVIAHTTDDYSKT